MTQATQLTHLGIRDIQTGLDAGTFSAHDVALAHVAAMEAARPMNMFITETAELALETAKAVDARRAQGDKRSLDGVPVAIKDNFCTQGVLSTASSRILENFHPTYESTVTRNLFEAGAVMVGKTNMDEFGMGSANTNSAFGPVLSPWYDPSRPKALIVPGGSSGGSSAAVAAGVAVASTGTDTGGSIRQPGAFCGLVGLKPTYGLCSRYGIMAFASSLDQAGPMTRSVEDAALMIGAMAGYCPRDSMSANRPAVDYTAALEDGVKGLVVGIPREYRSEHLGPDIARLWEQGIAWLKEAGAEIREISLAHTECALPTYYIIAPAEASSNLARYDGIRYGLRVAGDSIDDLYINTRTAGFGPEVQRRIMIGTYVLSAGYYDAYFTQAQKIRRLISRDFEEAYASGVDVILTPTAPTPAFALGENTDPMAMYLNDVYTVPASLAGLPAVSVPAGIDSKTQLPLGLQIIGRAFDEATILRAARVIEQYSGFSLFSHTNLRISTHDA